MKKLKSIALVALFMSTSLFVSCSSDTDNSNEETPEVTTGDYWPTAIGNQWVLNQSGSETTMKIISSEKINGETYFKFDKFFSSTSDVSASASASLKKVQGDYYIKLDDIVSSANGISSKISGYEFVFFKDYLEVNKTWTGSYTQTTTFDYPGIPAMKMNVKYTGTILEKGATVTIKNVTYKDVIKFKLKLETSYEGQTASSTEAEYSIAKGVGIIKFGFNNSSSELVSYKLN
ncbi:hypothetical protein IRZ71_06890 [Flavobacterium sp. ANB]|uniref:hypothetical protein n=1 Tax=unclassified Flavobacterium TaxID=196869 RepID=UPI0012BA2AEE|nr:MULTISPECIES: hypothetical protein [unclassified Flavobacterium]MBF4516060.1 hypothetical protein [Flavobacterium sp. ANB]MTD69062.1 hypothetical protein [Flavobacterium sp. LC2016-13]